MVKRILTFLNRETSGLHEAAYLLASFAFLSHILALVRDRLFAHFFGAGTPLDIYYAAFRIPDFIFVSVASIASLFVLIPFIMDRIDDKEGLKDFLSSIFTAFFIFIILVSVVVYFFVPSLTNLLYPGFSADMIEQVVTLTRIMLISPILLGISNIFASITQVSRRFFVYALSPVLYNIGIIVGIVWFFPLAGMPGLAAGVVLGALLHALIQLPIVLKSGFSPRITAKINWSYVWSVVKMSLPRTFTLATNQLALLFLLALASKMAEGSISIFNFGSNIQGVPLSLIGISYSVAAFPTLTKLLSNGEKDKFIKHMSVAVRHVVFWSLPAATLFIVLRAHIIRVALGSGEFGWEDTRLTAAVLALFVWSLVAQSLELLFIRGYYAAGRTAKPLVVKSIATVLTVVAAFSGVWLFNSNEIFRYFMESLLRINDVEGSVVIMLALAYSIGTLFSGTTFWFMFKRDFGKSLSSSLYKTLFHSFSAAIITGTSAYGSLVVFSNFLDINTFIGVFSQAAIAGAIGTLFGVMTLTLLGNSEMKEILKSARHKFWRARAVLPDTEEL